MDLNEFIRVIPDFPKPGISFKDITPLLLDAPARAACLEQLMVPLKDLGATKVIGVEARGFFFGMAIARALEIGFVPVRKPGKLPFETVAQSYDLEYGTDTLEIHRDAIHPGDRVIVHDDVLATGGTAAASCELIQKLGGQVVACSFLMELRFLNGREKLSGQTIHSVLSY